MPPPPLPKAAQGLARYVADTVMEITFRQKTDVSYSDVSRGVHKAIHNGLIVVDFTLAQKVCDEAHEHAEHGEGHNTADGFCRACAAIYVAVNGALLKINEVK